MIPIDDIAGLKVLITGASSGIGAAVARIFASCGAEICIHCHRNRAAADALASELGAGPLKVHVVSGDITAADDARRIVEAAVRKMGGLDCLINNAGGIQRTPIHAVEDDIYEWNFNLNTRSVLRLVQFAHPTLKQSNRASIINLGSIAGRNGGSSGSGVYAAAKAATHSLTRSLARELAGDGIRVNAVAPGVILTPFHDATPQEALDTMRGAVPMDRLGTAEDCAWSFVFLASPTMSGYVTGQIIDVNGGQFMP